MLFCFNIQDVLTLEGGLSFFIMKQDSMITKFKKKIWDKLMGQRIVNREYCAHSKILQSKCVGICFNSDL